MIPITSELDSKQLAPARTETLAWRDIRHPDYGVTDVSLLGAGRDIEVSATGLNLDGGQTALRSGSTDGTASQRRPRAWNWLTPTECRYLNLIDRAAALARSSHGSLEARDPKRSR